MPKTLIEVSSKKRFATRFMVLEDFRPTSESVLVFKESESSTNFLVLRYSRDPDGKIIQEGVLEEIPEEEFKSEHDPHTEWGRTTLKEYDEEKREWRTSTISERLEQAEDRDL